MVAAGDAWLLGMSATLCGVAVDAASVHVSALTVFFLTDKSVDGKVPQSKAVEIHLLTVQT